MEDNDIKIETDEFILRPWKEEDAKRLAVIANNRKIVDNLRDGIPHPYSIDDARQFITLASQNYTSSKVFAIEINGEASGSIGAFIEDNVHRKTAELGYYLAEEYWGKGIMTKVLRSMAKYLFENFDLIRVYAQPFANNTGSRRALEKAGFRLEGTLKNNVIKNDVVQDDCIYAILKDEL